MNPSRAVLFTEFHRYRAMLDHDVTALRELCDPSLRYVHPTGDVDSLDSWLAKIADGSFHYSRIEHPVDSVDVRGDVAVVYGRMIAHGRAHGRRVGVVSARTLSVLVRDVEGDWRLLAFQSTMTTASNRSS